MSFLRLCLVCTILCNVQLGSGTAAAKTLFDWFRNTFEDSSFSGATNRSSAVSSRGSTTAAAAPKYSTASASDATAKQSSKKSTNAITAKQASTESKNHVTAKVASTDLLASNRPVSKELPKYIPMLPPNSFPEIYSWDSMRIVRDNLGEGRNGVTKVVQFPNIETHFALKAISKSHLGKFMHGGETVLSEIATQRETNHNNVVKLIGAHEDRKNIYIVTELCEGGELYHAMKQSPDMRFDEPKAKQLAWRIADGIKHLHDLSIVHRDLKLENIFLTPQGVPKIGDFGFARKIINQKVYYLEGSESYRAPEVWNRSGHSFPADIWAFGVIIFAMLDGYFPFHTEALGGINNAKRGIFRFWKTDSESAKDLINHMIVVNVDSRYTIDQVIAHPWFDDIRGNESHNSHAQEQWEHVLEETTVDLALKEEDINQHTRST